MIAVVGPVGHYNMVEELDAHEFAGTLELFRHIIITAAGSEMAGRMIMADSENRGVCHTCLLDDDANVNGHLRDTTLRQTEHVDQPVSLIHQNHPELFDGEVTHDWVHLIIDARSRT